MGLADQVVAAYQQVGLTLDPLHLAVFRLADLQAGQDQTLAKLDQILARLNQDAQIETVIANVQAQTVKLQDALSQPVRNPTVD
jgi:hypothetical protein